MPNKIEIKGLSPAELLVYNLCDGTKTPREVYREILSDIEFTNKDPREVFRTCLEALKEKGLIVY